MRGNAHQKPGFTLLVSGEQDHALTAKAPAMITFLEERFGPYPFATAGVLFRPEMVGMETQTMITLDPDLPERLPGGAGPSCLGAFR